MTAHGPLAPPERVLSMVGVSSTGCTVHAGAYVRPFPGEVRSGDAVFMDLRQDLMRLAIVDALGHGPAAADIADRAVRYLERSWPPDLDIAITGLHGALHGTDGAEVGLSVLDAISGRLRYLGIGNTVCRIVGSCNTRLRSYAGIVGSGLPRAKETVVDISVDQIVLLYSDGVTDSFHEDDYPQILSDAPVKVSHNIVNRFGRTTDDASCLVFRYAR